MYYRNSKEMERTTPLSGDYCNLVNISTKNTGEVDGEDERRDEHTHTVHMVHACVFRKNTRAWYVEKKIIIAVK